jgi:uncharacterized protein YutE (UPF0331/DUF86 family)
MTDLERFRGISSADYQREHYAVERLIELLVEAASSAAFHILSVLEGTSPTSYRDAFRRLGELELIEHDLCQRLQLMAGMRNILVHGYEQVDHDIVYSAIGPCLDDMGAFVQTLGAMKLQQMLSGED